MRWFCLLCLLPITLSAAPIDTFYGVIEVEEPILLELIENPIFQRLKSLHQYGVGYYTTHREEYTRYAHSLGVFALLRAQGLSLEEQVAGLLHDVSHTVFSHVGDWIFGKEHQEKDYQNTTHAVFLEESGLGEILRKYHFTVDQILPTEESFPALECRLPNLCADRIDYNIQGAYYRGFITYEEAKTLFEGLQFTQGTWLHRDWELLKKLVRFSLFMTEHCWGSATNHLSSRWLADAILRGIDLGSISYEEIHFGTDQVIWDRLINHQDPLIRKKMEMLPQTEDYYRLVDPSDADLLVKSKFRGIDPWVLSEEGLVRLTTTDPILAQDYQSAKERIQRGWAIKFCRQVTPQQTNF
jgi:uncharacterized protein